MIALMALIPCLRMQGQNDLQKHELGIRMTSLNNFDFIYKKHRFDEKYLRFSSANISISNNALENTTFNQFQLPNISDTRNSFYSSIGFSIGWENRKSISNELWFVHGFEPGIALAFSIEDQAEIQSQTSNTSFNISPYLGYILGFQYNLSDKLYIGIESIPQIYSSIRYRKSDTGASRQEITNGVIFNFSTLGLNFVYRFSKERKRKKTTT